MSTSAMKVNGNFLKDFIIALAVGSVATILILTLVCILAQCGPRMFGRVTRRERWFGSTLEEGHRELPLVPGSSHLEVEKFT
ncbi:hypothetical protein F4821DRAFT_223598 [Hypoxylon rubiginosum]|uniref:Uncharacterized protein n=1 Tax=Hypoxylon rubiginosum TaxID=110542 RepID=A0ACC0DJS7_9PEZI|nr:hypothetical protein F4821DRAFT_223598 [Hypoxylon rubiginosum]